MFLTAATKKAILQNNVIRRMAYVFYGGRSQRPAGPDEENRT